VSGGLSFSTLALGNEHTCGITTGGATYCWGHNTSGQLGKATPEQTFTPIAIASDPGFNAITAGQFHTCAVTSAGATYCWGDNYYGQLGRGTFGYASVPAAVAPVIASAAMVLPRR
jgi:alpha-tubulin suppressor-like RCC1 family protein